MAFSTTTKHALRWLTGSSNVSDIDAGFQALAEDLDGKIAVGDQGALASRPTSTSGSPGKSSRYYLATDTGQLFRDNGTGWDEIPIGVGQRRDPGEYKYSVDAASHGSLPGGLFSWVLCDGSELDAGYTALISKLALLSLPFGAGPNGRPRVPDLKGRVPVHPDGSAARMVGPDALGQSGGEEKHTLTVTEMPAHSHTAGERKFDGASGSANAYLDKIGSGGSTSEGTSSTGGGGAHNNMQPYIVAGSWFIKT